MCVSSNRVIEAVKSHNAQIVLSLVADKSDLRFLIGDKVLLVTTPAEDLVYALPNEPMMNNWVIISEPIGFNEWNVPMVLLSLEDLIQIPVSHFPSFDLMVGEFQRLLKEKRAETDTTQSVYSVITL